MNGINSTRRPPVFDCETCYRKTANMGRRCRVCLGRGYPTGKIPTPQGGSVMIERAARAGGKHAAEFLAEHEQRIANHMQRIKGDLAKRNMTA